MKRISLTIAVLSLLLNKTAISQAPQAGGNSTLAQMQAIQATNRALIEQQKKTLQTLDAMKVTAEQLKAFGKRG